MRLKLLNRIILITGGTLLIGILLSLLLFNVVNVSATKTNLEDSSKLLMQALDRCNSLEDVKQLMSHSDQVLFYTVLNSDDEIIYDSVMVDLNPRFVDPDSKFIRNTREKGSNVKLGKPYEDSPYMLLYSTLYSNDKLDPNGKMLIRSAMVVVYNNEPFWLSLGIAFILGILMTMGSYCVINASINNAIEPFGKLSQSLIDITQGTFEKSDVSNSGDKEVDKIYDQLSEISEQLASSFTELKNEQTKSKFLLNSISQGIMAISKMGTIMINNPTLETIFDREDLRGANIDYILEGELLTSVKKSLADNTYSIYTLHKDKEVYRVECMPIVDQEYSIELENISLLIIFTDITQETETNSIRNEFFANASHELKTPLTAISGYSEILSLGVKDEKIKEKCIKEIMNNATKMKDLINDMMKLSKLDAKLDIEDESTFDLMKLCKEVVDDQMMVAKNKKVTVELNGVSANIVGRKEMIKIVVQNLVNNAIKYNRENGKVEVTVSQEKNYVKLTVSDTGIGIPKEHQGRIFERFYKVDGARTRTEEAATGLGLSIVKDIIVMHKAQIRVDSKENVGTTFTVFFNNITRGN